MMSGEGIRRSLLGAWRMMMGRADGLKLLDTSADGFWDSFFALVIAAPALAIGWLASANDFQQAENVGTRLSIVSRLAVVDVGVWILPLLALAIVVRHVGIADRFVHYVVSGNWASALLVWMMLPPSLMRLVAPQTADIASPLSMLLFIGSMVLTWRQTNAALGKGAAVATALFVGMFFAALIVLIALQAIMGLDLPDQLPG